MGTNYSRIPKSKDIIYKHALMVEKIMKLDIWDAANVNNHFRVIENEFGRTSPWEEFTDELTVHLGKRSMGWKFLWNFNEDKFFKDKESLLEFIKSGRILDEYGDELSQDEFIEMSFSWGQEDGFDSESYYLKYPESRNSWSKPERYVDGLRISDSTDFC